MTASNSNSANSENSDFQPLEERVDTTAHVHLIDPIVEYIDETTGPVHRPELGKEFQLCSFELEELLRWLEDEGYVERRGPLPNQDILLTEQSQWLLGGDQ